MNFQGEDLYGARGGTAQDCYDRCALNFVLGGECRAFTFLTDANAKGKRCWLKRPTYARGRRYPNPGTLSGVLETRGGSAEHSWQSTCSQRATVACSAAFLQPRSAGEEKSVHLHELYSPAPLSPSRAFCPGRIRASVA